MKLHIGCGNKYLECFKHVDIMEYSHIDFKTSCDDLYMIDDNSVEEIYACHVLEHVGRNDNARVIREWNRVLKPNGILRVSVPDFQAIVEEYEAKKNLNSLIGLLYGGQNYQYNYHYMTYDFRTLKELLEENNFKKVEIYDWNEFLPNKFDDFSKAYLPHMDIENGRLMSLNVVCRKVYE